MADPTAAFAKLVPGFDFLQGLVKNAGAALPNVGQWVAPTLNPEELEKRIEELRTVQFWLEQNARMLGATIQALEVQRMTLSTLKTMNLSFGDLTESLKIRLPEAGPAAAPAGTAAPAPAPAPAPRKAKARAAAQPLKPEVPAGVVDPMQWWGALTKQFTELATNAMKDTATDAAKTLATTMVKQSFDAAGETLKKAAAMPGAMAKTAASAAQKAATVAAGVARAPAAGAAAATRAAAAPRKRSAARR
ncbi:PhaM family polyhydroxyalkanoate granule multifunctional regulatory protein [Aquabacterium sp.]|uniref:PhaM family polyhydroxyalkanoate granule multifunctional regulatory protein n=1 Tax=Aquabacterium sp. TaxID=1872578 RepID=UPI0037850AF5